MSSRIFVLATILACFWYTTRIHTASIAKSEDFAELLQRLVGETNRHNHRNHRAIDESDIVVTRRICRENMPCGWTVYHAFTRKTDFYIKNECECPDQSYKCIRAEDHLTASAYAHRCRQNTTVDDIEAPEESS